MACPSRIDTAAGSHKLAPGTCWVPPLLLGSSGGDGSLRRARRRARPRQHAFWHFYFCEMGYMHRWLGGSTHARQCSPRPPPQLLGTSPIAGATACGFNWPRWHAPARPMERTEGHSHAAHHPARHRPSGRCACPRHPTANMSPCAPCSSWIVASPWRSKASSLRL